MLNAPRTPILSSLERLAALTSEDGGLIEIRPFRDWKGTSWQNKIFSMRLLNAGEMLDVYEYCEKFEGNAKDQAFYIEIVIRSLFSVDGQFLASDEEVVKYNETHKSSLSRIDYLRLWAANLEQIVLIRLHAIYDQLQLKQIRLINGQYLCAITGKTLNNIPPGSKKLLYNIAEILSSEGLSMPGIDLSLYDFEEDENPVVLNKIQPENTENTSFVDTTKEFDYFCHCGEGFYSIEDLTLHRETCTK